jgi:hypothetical protein
MPGFRRFTVPTLCLFLLFGVGAALASGRWRPLTAAAVAAVCAGHAFVATVLPQRTFDHHAAARLGVLAEATPGVDDVAVADIGRFGWHFRGRIFDLAGLTDARIARRAGRHGHKEWDEAYFRERSPDLVLVVGFGSFEEPLGEAFHVRPFEVDVLRSIVVEGGYRHHTSVPEGPASRILVFARDDVALDPALWGAPDERDLVAELRAFRARKLASAQ